jgi:hypothetical protein
MLLSEQCSIDAEVGKTVDIASLRQSTPVMSLHHFNISNSNL